MFAMGTVAIVTVAIATVVIVTVAMAMVAMAMVAMAMVAMATVSMATVSMATVAMATLLQSINPSVDQLLIEVFLSNAKSKIQVDEFKKSYASSEKLVEICFGNLQWEQ